MVQIKDRKFKIFLGIVLGSLLFLLIWKVGKPAYDRYVENDHAITCVRVRFVIINNYNHVIEDQMAQGQPANEIDDEMILNNVLQDIQETFPETQVEEMTASAENSGSLNVPADASGLVSQKNSTGEASWEVSHLCRSGGVYTITIDAASHRLNTVCSLHGEYNLGYEPFTP